MAKHRTHSIEFKRQIAQDFIAGETPFGGCRARMAAFSAATARRASIERLIAYPTTRRDQASRMAAI